MQYYSHLRNPFYVVHHNAQSYVPPHNSPYASLPGPNTGFSSYAHLVRKSVVPIAPNNSRTHASLAGLYDQATPSTTQHSSADDLAFSTSQAFSFTNSLSSTVPVAMPWSKTPEF